MEALNNMSMEEQDATLSQGVPRDAAVNFDAYRSFHWHRATFTAVATLSN